MVKWIPDEGRIAERAGQAGKKAWEAGVSDRSGLNACEFQ